MWWSELTGFTLNGTDDAAAAAAGDRMEFWLLQLTTGACEDQKAVGGMISLASEGQLYGSIVRVLTVLGFRSLRPGPPGPPTTATLTELLDGSDWEL